MVTRRVLLVGCFVTLLVALTGCRRTQWSDPTDESPDTAAILAEPFQEAHEDSAASPGVLEMDSAPPAETTEAAKMTEGPKATGSPPPASDFDPPRATPAAPSTPVERVENRPSAPSSPPPSETYPIRLSTGVALAQTLPEGTAMGFSVTYRLDGAPPTASGGYVWVIESSNTQPYVMPVQLDPSGGELYTFVTAWRPENGPFRCFIGDRNGRRLSRTIDLR